MKHLFIFLFSLCLSTLEAQECSFLEHKKGIRDIVLGASIKENSKFIKRNDSNLNLFKYYPDADYVYVGTEDDKIKTIPILNIYLNIENGLITEITVVTHRILSLFSILEAAYGDASVSNGRYEWKSKSVICTAIGDGNPKPGYLIIYKNTSEAYQEVMKHKQEDIKEAQQEL